MRCIISEIESWKCAKFNSSSSLYRGYILQIGMPNMHSLLAITVAIITLGNLKEVCIYNWIEDTSFNQDVTMHGPSYNIMVYEIMYTVPLNWGHLC